MTSKGTITGVAALAAIGAAVAAQMPEIKRYLNIRRM
jgi:hypothetical protein